MKKVFFSSVCILLIFFIPANSQILPSGFSSTNIASGWTNPVGAAFSKDGLQLFVWEKRGRVYVCNRNSSGTYNKQSTPVLDISVEVLDWRDHGLVGFALDPNFAGNGLIYLLYAVDRRFLMNDNSIPADYLNYEGENKATIGRVTRYKTIINGSDNLVIDQTTRTILIGETPSTGIPILHESHGMGSLAFASDGTLLVSAGDGASYATSADGGSVSHTYYQQALDDEIIRPEENVGAFKSQMLNSHNGKLLRINPENGDGVSSNPFFSAAEPRSPKSRVWALGFRNPFRFSLRPGTGSTDPSTGDIGEIYVGDVGFNVYEDLNIIKAPGMNCGWPLYEGHTTLSSYMNLTTTNQDEPNPLYGAGCTRQYFRFKELLKQATADNITTIYNPCDASEPIGTGNRYFHRRPAIDWHHNQDLARVGIFNGNNADVATIGTPESNVVGSPFRGNCAVAGVWYTGDAFPANYKNTFFQADYGAQWIKRITIDYTDVVTRVDNFGTNFSGIVCVTQNPLDGTLVTVQISSSTGVKRISYGGNQLPVVKMSSDKIYGPSPLTVNFTGNTSFDPDGTIASYAWNFGDPTSANNTSTSANPSHTFTFPSDPKKYVVKLTVTDNQGASSTDSIIISVNNTPPVVNITSPVKNSTYMPGGDTTYALSATVTDTEHNPGQLKYEWQTFLRHNNHEHSEPIDTTRNTATTISRIGCNGDTYYWHVELTVTDAAGLSTIDSSQIFPFCIGAGPLPIVLRKFSVTQRGNQNLVKWTTESEMYIEYFEVERSSDALNFLPVSQTPARNSSGPNEYSFTDNNFPAGVNYYRLKIIETDLTVRYSAIVKTFSEIKSEGLVISPNPVADNFSISYVAADNGLVIIRISDIRGKLINTIHESVNRGQNIIYLQSMPAWKSGMYLVSVRQGNDIQHGKLIKAE
jgi:glucose/arabinose dehydrogenase